MKQFFRKYFWFLFGEQEKPAEIKFHPVLMKPISYVMTVDNMVLYEFINTEEMPKGRFAFAQKFYHETQNKCTKEVLLLFIEACKKNINDGKLGEAFKLLDELEYRTNWLFEPETLYRFASVMYFTLDEDLTDYDFKFNDNKIEAFKKKETLQSLLPLLSQAHETLLNLSQQDLQIYLQELTENLKKQLQLISESKGSS